MEQADVKKEIGIFLDSCVETRKDFISKLKKAALNIDQLKYAAVSKYHVTVVGKDTFNQRVKLSFLAEIEFLETVYHGLIKKLNRQYLAMMKDHKQKNDDWKIKRNWQEFEQEYETVTKEVLQEKIGFRQEVEDQCKEIRENAEKLLTRLNQLFSEDVEDTEVKTAKVFLTYLAQENTDTVMVEIMHTDPTTTSN